MDQFDRAYRRVPPLRRPVFAVVIMVVLAACSPSAPNVPTTAATSTAQGDGSTAPSDAGLGTDYFEGQTIRVIVPLGPGGGTDIAARLMATIWKEHIPGTPNMIAENVEGAGGALGMAAAFGEPADCLTVVVITAGVKSRWLLGQEGHDYPLDQFHAIAGFGGGTVVTVSLSEVAETTDDLADMSDPFLTGHTFPDGTGALVEKITSELLPYPLQQTFGYEGYGEVALAVQRMELEGSSPTELPWLENFLPLEEEGLDLSVLFQHGVVDADGEIARSTLFPDVPTFLEEYERIHGEAVPEGVLSDAYTSLAQLNTSSFVFLVHPDSDPACVSALRSSFESAVDSETWAEESAAAFGEQPIFIPGAETGLDKLGEVPDSVREWILENGQAD